MVDGDSLFEINSFEKLVKFANESNESNTSEYLHRTNNKWKKFQGTVDPRTFHLLSTLNDDQRSIINNIICKSDTNDGSQFSITLMDARPGCGKTHTVACLGIVRKLTYIVYNRALSFNMGDIGSIQAMTCAKFMMRVLKIPYFEYLHMWHRKDRSLQEIENYLLSCIKEATRINSSDILVIDEYNVLSPWVIVFIILYAKKFDCTLLFTGDKNQQDTIDRTPFHSYSNYELIRSVTNYKVSLHQEMRFDDLKYLKFITKLKDLIEDHNVICPKDVPMNYKHKYFIYEQMRDKFYSNINKNNLYMAQFHRQIKKHTDELDKKNTNKRMTAYIRNIHGEDLKFLGSDQKFKNYIIIVESEEYFYFNNQSRCIPVVVESFDEKKQSVLVTDEDGKKFTIKRVSVNEAFINELQLKNIRSQLDNMGNKISAQIPNSPTPNLYGRAKLFQFPLTRRTMTYHRVQGMTIGNVNVDINIDSKTLNAVYVGFSRVKRESQIGYIESEFTQSLEYTYFKNDEYYYLINRPYETEFDETTCVSKFNRINPIYKNFKIKKSRLMNFINGRVKKTQATGLELFCNAALENKYKECKEFEF
jgi:hypothetical protein